MYTTVLSILHRITGLSLSVAILLLAGWVMALAAGRDAYGLLLSLYLSPLGRLAFAGIIVAFWYHFCAGIRHLVFDTGRGMERAAARRSAAVLVVAVVILSAATLFAVLHGGGHP